MNFIKKNLSNILFFAFIIFLFTPYGLPVRVFFIKGVSVVKTKIFSVELDEKERTKIDSYQWELQDFYGKSVAFEAFEDKVIVINFWATWCPPCVAEMPSLQELYNAYGDRVSFLFVANDEKDKVEKYMKRKNFNFPVYYQLSHPAKQLQSSSLPTTFILDKNGEIYVRQVGAIDWNSARVKKLLDKLLQ
jgi:thiol-disulfide isomerase/thioredoxin